MPTPALTLIEALSALLTRRIAAKQEEDSCVAFRRGIDAEIIALFPAKEEGTVSEKTSTHKVAATYSLDRKADTLAIQTDWETLPAEVQGCFRFTADVSIKPLKALSADHSAIASKYITTKPASPSLKLEPIAPAA